jgi:hypothetical protein
MKRIRSYAVVGLLLFAAGCSSTTTSLHEGASDQRPLRPLLIGKVAVDYSNSLAPDRKERAQEHSIAQRLASRVRAWLEATKLSPGDNELEIELREFRLPASGTRWMTAQFKGNDYLGASVTVHAADGAELVSAQVRTQLGAMDRSIGENYSADFALDNMLDNLAWRIVFELIPPGQDDPFLELAKAKGVVPAIQELGWRGELTYAEALKYSASDTFRGDAKLAACASSLAKPGWMPAFLWDFPLFGLHGSCIKLANEHRWQAKALVTAH